MNTILIGTYTRKSSEGIYRLEFDPNNETFNNLSLVVEAENPTYLEYHKPTKTLYAVYDHDGKGGIALYDYNDSRAILKEVIADEGSAPCYVHYNDQTKEYYSANYHRGFVDVYKEGALKNRIKYEKGAKAHYVNTHPITHALYTVDLGNDTVHKYKGLEEVSHYLAPIGSGPRHLVFHPKAPVVYLFTELTCDLIVLKDGDHFEQLQIIKSIPEDATPSGAAIRISNDGKFVYVSNRTHDSITVFAVQDDYTVKLIQNISTQGQHPRDFNLNPENTHLMVLNRDSNNLVLFRRDNTTGLLTLISKDMAIPEGVCLIFIDEDER